MKRIEMEFFLFRNEDQGAPYVQQSGIEQLMGVQRLRFFLSSRHNNKQMWQLFCQLGLYFSVYAAMPHTKVDASSLLLDPITVAGIVYIALLKKRCGEEHMKDVVRFALPALKIITEELPPDLFTLPSHCRQERRFTASKWKKHLDSLRQAMMLVPCALPRLKHVARYFGVPKNENVARAIWNGRFLTEHTRKAPPVNLPAMPDILRRMHDMSHKGNLCMLTADFRHYFHTIKVSEELSRMFGVAVETPDGGLETFRWATLPMGWGLSPWIASSVGYAAILWRKPDEEILFPIEEGLTQLPTFVPVVGGGFLCLYYDNIFVVHTDYRILEKVQKRLERNFSGKDHGAIHFVTKDLHGGQTGLEALRRAARPYGDGVNIPLGAPIQMYSSKKLCTEGCQAEYLGVAFSLRKRDNKRGRDGTTFHLLRHRQCAKKHAKWMQLEPKWTQPHTARDLAAYIGKILWRHSISMRPMCAIAPVISILRRLASHRLETKSTWDDCNFHLNEDEVATMTLCWNICQQNEWHEFTPFECARKVVRLVSDSSDSKWGYLIFTDEGSKAFEKGHDWSLGLRPQHIFIKELCAAVFAIKHVISVNPDGVDIHIGIDNSAAANAIRNMYSGNVLACRILDGLHADVARRHARIFVHGLRSEDNASDAASRGRKATEEQVENCFKHLTGLEEGHRLSVPDDFLQRAGVVHDEHDSSETNIDDLLGLEELRKEFGNLGKTFLNCPANKSDKTQ